MRKLDLRPLVSDFRPHGEMLATLQELKLNVLIDWT
jgi:hypothetical protein